MAATGGTGGTGGASLRRLLFDAGKKALEERGEELKTELGKFTGKGKSMDATQSLDMQFKVGEFNNLTQAVTGMEKMMKDSIAAIARNTT